MPPENIEHITYFAKTDMRNKQTPFGIKAEDRTRHVYIIGKTGMGKSTLLENMAIQDIKNGEGFAFIDPHGKTADLLLDYIPESRLKDVLYFAPFDMDHPIAFNVMEDVGYDKRHLVVAGLMAAFKKIWVDAWSARMEYILQNTLLALLEYPDSTMLDVNRMYTDRVFREKVVGRPGNSKMPAVEGFVKDPLVRSFWLDEYAAFTDRYTQEATPAIQNKIGQFTGNPLIRNIVGQSKSTFDLREMMDKRKILIVNLSKGQVGEGNANLLGSMLITKIYLAALSRADVTQADLARLPNFYLYVDEFQSFANESFADILSEARKYKLNLTMAHQYIEQMSEEVRAAVFGNVGTMICFRVGAFDAEVLEKEFAPQFTAQDLVNLGFAQVYLRLMIDGVSSQPFSAKTLPPLAPPEASSREAVIERSHTQFARPRAEVEASVYNKYNEQQKEKEQQAKDAALAAREAAARTSSTNGPLFRDRARVRKEERPLRRDTLPEQREQVEGPKELPKEARPMPEDRAPVREREPMRVMRPPESEEKHQPFATGLRQLVEEIQSRGVSESSTTPATPNNIEVQPRRPTISLGESIATAMRKEKEREAPPIERPTTPKNRNDRGATPERMQSLREALAGVMNDADKAQSVNANRQLEAPGEKAETPKQEASKSPPPQKKDEAPHQEDRPKTTDPREVPEAVLRKVLEVDG